ncbi:hypothetical protein PRO82_000653 [Candidatus Protochlamydia amoebophila]|uniref:hypothetical protein n=1 Tax=Candidatus Protochlamydia TaxID=282132 RepID=UPI0005A890F3|nr:MULTISPECIES: hypothetical protein [Protochlamydia]MBS4163352.1 hypothetical protein [Candidatus Protochlamydia amoebophila]
MNINDHSTFNTYLDFSSGANGLKIEIAKKYVTIKAHEKAKKLFSKFSSEISENVLLASRKLAREAYAEFNQKLKEKYKDPIYEFPLNSYLRTETGFFDNTLKFEIRKEMNHELEELLKQKPLTPPVQIKI